ncbi:hypothetical protein [Novipirellula artificiosorum]|uniref:hypothetical protein n=1 Tax=Novipirellula artificiosorum TaxID=2528016 RepID=UPI0011B76E25|nr:hypothetical protein [Novipirellula artificiosorum]
MKSARQSRRDLLLLGSALLAGGIAPIGLTYAEELSPQSLAVDPSRVLFRVRIEIDGEGNVNVPTNPLVSRKSDRSLPLKSDVVFDYEERLRRADATDVDSVPIAAERFFHEANSDSEVNRSKIQAALRPSVCQSIVRRDTLPEITYSSESYFTHEELDLLRMPVSSIAVDRLLPTDPVVKGDQYVVESESLRALFGLSAVDASEVKGEIVALSTKEARVQLRGNLDGSVDGVPTKLRIVGKLTFDRTMGVTTWLAMAIHETRDISKAEPGFDVASTIKMIRKPLDKPFGLQAQPEPLDIRSGIPEERLYVELQSDTIGMSTLMDRRWRMMSDKAGLTMMRMIENDRSIAQCDFRRLSRLAGDKQWTMNAFQQDVRKTLGEQWREFVVANERVTETGLVVMTLVARGAVEEVPIEWVIQHYSDDSGRRVLATFTMEGDAADSFAGSDDQLASTLRMIHQPSAAQELPDLAEQESSKPEDRLSDESIQSASDRR